jgi:hypothetical protein
MVVNWVRSFCWKIWVDLGLTLNYLTINCFICYSQISFPSFCFFSWIRSPSIYNLFKCSIDFYFDLLGLFLKEIETFGDILIMLSSPLSLLIEFGRRFRLKSY